MFSEGTCGGGWRTLHKKEEMRARGGFRFSDLIQLVFLVKINTRSTYSYRTAKPVRPEQQKRTDLHR